MDAAVQNELFQGQTGDFPAHRVEAGHGDGLGGVINDEIHAGHGLQGADVAALPADDAALHLVVGQGHHRDGGFGHMVGGAALDGQGDLLPGVGIGLFLEAGLDLLELDGLLMGDLVFQLVNEVALGFLGGKARDLLEQLKLLGLHPVQLLPVPVKLGELGRGQLFLALQVLGLAVQGLFLLVQAVFLALELAAAVLDLAVELGALPQDLLLGLHGGLALFALGAFDGLVDDPPCLFFGGADLALGGSLSPLIADDGAGGQAHQKGHNDQNDRQIKRHCFYTSKL